MLAYDWTIVSFITIFLFIALASRQLGIFLARLGLPLITGFLLVGMIAGPYLLKLMPADAIERLRFVDEFSLAFIAFAAGSELVVRQIRSRLKAIRYTTFTQVVLMFLIGSLAFFLLSDWIPFANRMAPAQRFAVAILAGAILVARSPSSAIAVVNELRAKGPFTQTALGVTVIMDVIVIALFSVCASVAGILFTQQGFNLNFILILLGELFLALLLGVLLSQIFRWVLSRRIHKFLKIFSIMTAGYGVFVLTAAFRHLSHTYLAVELFVEPLLICLLASFITANYSPYRTELVKVLHDVGPFVYVAFFTLTGASLRLDILSQCWAIALILFGVRAVSLFISALAGGLLAGEPMKFNKIAWMSYITQAGVGLGLAKQVTVEFPEWGAAFATIMIAVIVLNQIVGPPLFKLALYWAKEANPRSESQSHENLRDAVIFGLEGASLSLARLLQANDWEVKIATTQLAYAKQMADEADIEIHPISELSLASLNKLGVGNADAIVAMLSDEENYRICELVQENYGVPNLIVRLNHREHFKRFHELGVLVVEPSTAIVNLLDQFVRSPVAARLLLGLEKGREVIEFELCNPDLNGLAIRELHLPLDIHILSLRRGGQFIVSGGFTRLEVGDWLTVVGSRSSLEQMMLQFGENRKKERAYMVGRATASEMASQKLDQEVMAIMDQSGEKRRQKFNRLIEDSRVLDLEAAISYDQFFERVARALSEDLDLPAEMLFRFLLDRENEISTALRPDLAVPHILIEGQDTFRILLARCREGIYFSDLAPKVQAAFVLVGTRDQRDYHLYTLSAIAEIVQQSFFQQRWLKAKDDMALRHLARAKKHS